MESWRREYATIDHLGIESLRTPPQSPQANSFVERLNGTLRRELLEHVWPLGLRNLNWLLERYAAYYNHSVPTWASMAASPFRPTPFRFAPHNHKSSATRA